MPNSIDLALCLTLDTIGRRYGLLPSDVITRASTFDLAIMDIAVSYENEQNRKNTPGQVPDVPIEELMRMRASV